MNLEVIKRYGLGCLLVCLWAFQRHSGLSPHPQLFLVLSGAVMPYIYQFGGDQLSIPEGPPHLPFFCDELAISIISVSLVFELPDTCILYVEPMSFSFFKMLLRNTSSCQPTCSSLQAFGEGLKTCPQVNHQGDRRQESIQKTRVLLSPS